MLARARTCRLGQLVYVLVARRQHLTWSEALRGSLYEKRAAQMMPRLGACLHLIAAVILAISATLSYQQEGVSSAFVLSAAASICFVLAAAIAFADWRSKNRREKQQAASSN